jgi:hypothetical protein
VAAYLLKALLGWVFVVQLPDHVGRQRVLSDLRSDLFTHVQTLDLGCFETPARA